MDYLKNAVLAGLAAVLSLAIAAKAAAVTKAIPATWTGALTNLAYVMGLCVLMAMEGRQAPVDLLRPAVLQALAMSRTSLPDCTGTIWV